MTCCRMRAAESSKSCIWGGTKSRAFQGIFVAKSMAQAPSSGLCRPLTSDREASNTRRSSMGANRASSGSRTSRTLRSMKLASRPLGLRDDFVRNVVAPSSGSADATVIETYGSRGALKWCALSWRTPTLVTSTQACFSLGAMDSHRSYFSLSSRLRISAHATKSSPWTGSPLTSLSRRHVGRGARDVSFCSAAHSASGIRSSAAGEFGEKLSSSQTCTTTSGPNRASLGSISSKTKVSYHCGAVVIERVAVRFLEPQKRTLT
mmetsp:Transcript_24088/g.81192  ORF Transcript_24088/g.81192 Transcript_24088/m.81192 type:complete len:263 (-) Transcript_24088:2480-3268(-)